MALLSTAYYLGVKMKQSRKRRKITQAKLAEMTGVSRKTIIDMEAGGNVSIQIIFRALSVMGMGMDIMDRRTDFQALLDLDEDLNETEGALDED